MTLDHPIFTRWPAQYPDRLQLFSAPTPNALDDEPVSEDDLAAIHEGFEEHARGETSSQEEVKRVLGRKN